MSWPRRAAGPAPGIEEFGLLRNRADNERQHHPRILLIPLIALVTATAAPPAPAIAQAPAPATRRVVPASTPPARAVATPAPAATSPRPVAAAPAADPYGFTAWLNGVRAQYGLPPVGYDPNLSGWAAANNAQQQARGLGHFVMGPARRQNAAVGSAASIGAQWMNSPAHRAALLDPSIRWIGLAGLGMYWTFNAY
jgi:uncharacterized protein YkwD